MSEPLQVLLGDRQTGKSTQAVAWVSNGIRTKKYPGWSRVLVCPHLAGWKALRREFWGRLEDFDHRIYDLHTWGNIQNDLSSTEVCLDDADVLLTLRRNGLHRIPGRVTHVVLYGRTWEPETFTSKVEFLG